MTRAIGAQRLYKAVKNGNIGIVVLFLSSANHGRFSYQKTYEAWVEGGKKPDMLDALLQHGPLCNASSGWHRRGKQHFNNDEFAFLKHVLSQLQCDEPPDVAQHQWLKDTVKVLVSHNAEKILNESTFSATLSRNIAANHAWPWDIAAESRGLGWGVAVYPYEDTALRAQAIRWFLDMHGPVMEEDFENYSADLNRLVGPERYEDLKQLINDDALLKQYLRNKQSFFIAQKIRGYNEYQKLLAIAPWMGEK